MSEDVRGLFQLGLRLGPPRRVGQQQLREADVADSSYELIRRRGRDMLRQPAQLFQSSAVLDLGCRPPIWDVQIRAQVVVAHSQ
jgi:hypothetical protein